MGRKVGFIGSVSGLFVLGLASSLAGGMLTGCAVAPVAPIAPITCMQRQAVLPATATIDHSATAPANQQAFSVEYVGSAVGCPLTPIFIGPPSAYTWVSSDTVNAPISNVAATAGVATCVGATTVPVTISISSHVTTTLVAATLTCK